MMKRVIMLALTASMQVSAQSVPSMAVIPLELSPTQTLPLDSIIHFEVSTRKPAQLTEYLSTYKGLSATQLDSETVAIAMSQQPQFTGPLNAQYSQASFVIDTDEAPTQAFIDGFANQQQSGELDAITAYVSQYINDPTYIHGFNLASTVATQRAGDCSEYATLTTALARGMDLNARLVIGTVIVENDDTLEAVGHAWTEVWYKGHWQLIDAALYGATARQLFYLPAGVLDNEGPGFAMALARAVTLMPNQVSNVSSLK